jgi:hypothetical protein
MGLECFTETIERGGGEGGGWGWGGGSIDSISGADAPGMPLPASEK